jgi:hypothetical protein
MQYLISVIHDQAGLATPDRLQAEGYWVFAGGLADTDAATVIDNRGEQAVFSDGPFVESKEYLAGVWVWEPPDLDSYGDSAAAVRKHARPTTKPSTNVLM